VRVEYVGIVTAPQVQTLAAVDVTYTSASLEGQITNNALDCEYWFTYWSEDGVCYTSVCGSDADGPLGFTKTISDLKPDTTYSYQAHASNSAGSASGATMTFTTPGLLADLSKDAPHTLRIENVHSKMPTRTCQLVYKWGATEGGNDAADTEFTDFRGVQVPLLLTKVGAKYLQVDARDPSSKTPFYLQQVFYSDVGFARVSGGDTNAISFSFPTENNGAFADRLITLQEYLPSPADGNIPDPNAQSYPVYDVRQLIADGDGIGVVALPDLPNRIYNGTGHYFVVRMDRVSLVDFNDDRQVDANDYDVLIGELGKIGNSMGDIASLKPDGQIVVGIPDGKVDDTDGIAFEQEQADFRALCTLVYGSEGNCSEDPQGAQAIQILTAYTLGGGTIAAPGAGSFMYDHGVSVSVAASPQEGYRFVDWTGSAVRKGKVANSKASATTVVMDADYTLQANFVQAQQVSHILTVSSTAGGSVTSPGIGAFTYGPGTSVALVANPQAGYEFVNWTGSAVEAGKVANPNASSTTVTVDANYAVVANFAKVGASGGTVPVAGESWVVPDLGMTMAYVEPGSLQMGSNNGGTDEKPVHTVQISKGFWMGECEVTQAQYQAIMSANPSQYKGSDRPVETISWNNATAFCLKLTQRESAAGRLPVGYSYRLPTEAQWEYGARGGTKNAGFEYAGSNDPGSVAWYSVNSGDTSHPVGQKLANQLSLHDMSGNVSEWCNDWYGEGYYATRAEVDPKGPATGSQRVYRGGGHRDPAWWCRSTVRPYGSPDFAVRTVGMRVVLSAD
jgi:formylglycine-generating enzyme required for sulfatase activity